MDGRATLRVDGSAASGFGAKGMAPKALTDCPENLRESIDWLLQLCCCGGIPALSNALGKLFDNVSQDAQKSLSSLSEADGPAARDVILRLSTFQNSVTENSANLNQNFLHHLCSSVAKFVGYKPPGTYDGSGIVYGDASRLCDAVLEFLHSVFSDVYNNQPYVAGRPQLQNVVRELEKSRWTGHHGFKHVIPKVADGLGEYNKKVKASNEKVRKPIDGVIAFVKENGELLTELNSVQADHVTGNPDVEDAQVSKVAGLVEKCKEVAKDFSRRLDSAKTAIGDLNPKLRSKLENARKSFFNHVGWLSKWSRKGQKKKLDEMIHKIKTRLRRLGKEVKEKIRAEVHELVSLLKERVKKIKRKLEDISESLAKYVQDLVKWMDDAKLYINEVKKYVDKILKEIYGENKQKIDQAAGEIDRTLSEKVTELTKWIEAADAAVQAAKVKAEQVHGRLDHSDNNGHPKTPIGQGVKQIRDAKDKVKQVDDALQAVHTDLGNWKNAANSVLSAAVDKARDVHGKLDPNQKDDTHPIGHNIEKIHTSNEAIKKANEDLKTQVESLHSWIGTAEDIRHSAAEKATEAYDKLDVHAELSRNIQKIVDANERIKNVNNSLNGVHGNLGAWNQQARTVLAGAIEKAQSVHDALLDGSKEVGQKITSIEIAKGQIEEANSQLAGHVKDLKDWKSAAGSVIDKADRKCNTILEKAAKQAKEQVGNLVTDALEAVVRMDSDLKRDLKSVKMEIKEGIKEVITFLQVTKLDGLVKDDLGELRGKIEGLGKDVESNGLVKAQLEKLAEEKKNLETVTGKTTGTIDKEMGQLESKFNTYIKTPLNLQVTEVDTAIGTLGGKFELSGGSEKKLEEIFKQIKGKLGEIKGEAGMFAPNGTWESNNMGSGLDGIKSKVHNYAQAFSGDRFADIVKGWLEATILRYNGTVRRILNMKQEFDETRKDGNIEDFAIGMKEKLKTDVIGIATDAFQNVNIVSGSITENIKAVQQLCNGLANALDEELYSGTKQTVKRVKDVALQKGQLVAKIQSCICECDNCNKQDCGKKAAAELILCALTSTVRQVGNELHSVFLYGDRIGQNSGTSIAQELDTVVGVTRTLHKNLGAAQAAANGRDPPTSSNQDTNKILQSVQGIERKVKEGMKDNSRDGNINVNEVMTSYKEKKDKAATNSDGKYQMLLADIPQAMQPFTTEAKLKDPKGVAAQKGEVQEHLSTIEKELQEIAERVDSSKKKTLPQPTDQDGIKQRLSDLDTMLEEEESVDLKDKGLIVESVKGLDAIREAIETLKADTYDDKTKHIGDAVQTIKLQLGVLRGKLKNTKDDDVIQRLTDLKENGLEGKNGWKGTEGLTKIQQGIQEQNTELGKQPEIITNAISAIRDQLFQLGIKLNKPFDYDDVLDKLIQLQRKLGTADAQNYGVNLKKIYDEIHWQQISTFTHKPYEIQAANSAIKAELKAQMSTLDNDVITTLNDLMTNGLSNQASWKPSGQEAAKGFDHIISELNTQQSTLEQQPTAIGSGVTQITNEIDELRSELQGKDDTEPKERGVIKNMEFMIKKIGTNDDDPNSLRKIKKEIEDLNRDTVPKVTEHLDKLCAKIASEAGSVDWQLGLFKKNNIDKDLAKIKSQIDTLRTGDLQEAIAMCDKFLTNADYIKWEKVENIERFVDSEIEKAIAELTKEARRDYVESAKDALKHFALKAESELETLPKEINRDLFQGFKGLMKYAYGHFDSLQNVREEKEIAVISSAFHSFYAPVNEYVSSEIRREHREREGEKNPLLPKSQDDYTDELNGVYSALSALLTHITGAQRYGHEVRGLLDALDKALTGLRPERFARPGTAVIDGVVEGLGAFAAELSKAYVSAYSGAGLTGDLVSSEAVSERSVTVLTPYGEKLSKVFLSVAPILDSSLTRLRMECKSLAGQHLNSSTDLGRLLGEMGYRVPDYGEQDGELDSHVTGRGITMLLVGDFERVFNSDKHTKNALGILLECLNDYYKACHYAAYSSTRSPCNVYEMLVWLTGLPHNCVYDKLCKFTKLCYSEQTENSLYPATLTADALVAAVGRLTADCPAILTRVLGYGSALTTYACDFHSNSMRLYYPQDGEECLHMMLHCVRLLLSVLRFLSSQCSLPAHHGGWAECRYGKGVPPYMWQCSPPLTALPTPHPECTDKSPLMSYLNDCLPGHLPHQCTKWNALPHAARLPGFLRQHQDGQAAVQSADQMVRQQASPIAAQPRTQTAGTLAEHIGFALSLVNDWHDGKIVPKNSLQQALEASATDLSLRLYNQPGDLTAALTAAYGSDSAKHGGCKHPHLTHLAGTDVCTRHQASPFLQALCRDSYDSLAYRHSDLYLSWAVYLPWTLYDLLLCLYTAFKEISCRDWSCDACLHEGPCDPDSHGVLNPKAPVHGCRCPSIVQCTGVMPTLYQYGLTFKDAPALISQNTTCFSFSTQLSQVLHSEYFRDLFHKCDEFLWHIRMPFLFTIVTLWLTTTLYILHSLLYRMDILCIRSHLFTTRASHLIDVKALLTKGRKMLSLYHDVDYFDDDFHS
ncbi:Extracellular matrix-binding ebh, putative [Babesia ovata]|uniref:Extracellular matrix-binding ebh, putative n=1 Tax=Babesia ovata TaxID=189622 RepID=A0A2H6KDT9_9APIC|nr:Extracellular matrix-binding ebh, putative [Babesia ovata]GBE61170.1 Extracellular matrix-binding ebh, putative [Babesia ovata]